MEQKKKGSTMRKIVIIIGLVVSMVAVVGCGAMNPGGTKGDIGKTQSIGDELSINQPTPIDIDYSLERFNLIRRTYWVNGQGEKAMKV